jgi:hypothetical protein
MGGGIVKADAHTSVISANVVKHCVWLLQRPQVADIAASLASNLLQGVRPPALPLQLLRVSPCVTSVTFLQSSTGPRRLMPWLRCVVTACDCIGDIPLQSIA